MTFVLHEKLAADTAVLASLPLCELLLMKDARFPWCILVPRRAGARDMIDLTEPDALQLFRESLAVPRALHRLFTPDKLNVAAIGNLVPQLHVHHVARFRTDSEWPAPVWGRGTALPYAPEVLAQRLHALREAIEGEVVD